MKSILTFLCVLSIHIIGFCQLPFAPLGATWGFHYKCWGGEPPPYDFTFTVTEDTVIQGKYCTKLRQQDWVCSQQVGPTYVHDDNGKVYRYDLGDDEFQLVFDYTKQVGESWRIKVCEEIFSTDSLTFFVIWEDVGMKGIEVVSDSGGWFGNNFILYEGMGGDVQGYPLLFGILYLVHSKPPCEYTTTCYQDPTLGIIYGGFEGSCVVPTEEINNSAQTYLKLFPNPVMDYLQVQLNSPQTGNEASFRILNPLGKVMTAFQVDNFQSEFSVPVWEWAAGIYFLQYLEEGEVRTTERFVKQ